MKKSSEKGSITVNVLVSMIFFFVVVTGIYVSSSNKLTKQNRDIERIQKEYTQEDIDEAYLKANKQDENANEEEEELELISSAQSAVLRKTKLKDEYENIVVVPEGFRIVNTSAKVTDGIIIEDADSTRTTYGSQFVWIPVGTIYTSANKETSETITLDRYDFSSSTGVESVYSGKYKEDEDLEYTNTRAKNIEDFKTSVASNKGYYIGRYEAGIKGSSTSDKEATTSVEINSNTTTFQKNSTTSGAIVTKENVGVWNMITQPNAASVCRNMYSSESKIESDLLNSYSWDTAIIFIQKCGQNNKYSKQKGKSIVSTNSPQLTGTNSLLYNADGDKLDSNTEKDIQCNICDMAGNISEWTTETCYSDSTPSVHRGSYFNSTVTTSYRNGDSSTRC